MLTGAQTTTILAGKGSGAEVFKMEHEVILLSKSNRKEVRNFDKDLYKERHLIERIVQ